MSIVSPFENPCEAFVMTIGVAFVLEVMETVAAAGPSVQTPVMPRLVGAGEPMTLIVSPGAILAAVAPVKNVFQRLANVVPSFESLPPS